MLGTGAWHEWFWLDQEETPNLARALVAQREFSRAALLREALEVGLLLIAASGPPAADGPADTYGTLACASGQSKEIRMLLAKHIHTYDDSAEPAVDPFPETQYWENGEEGGADDGISPLPPNR